MPTGYTAPIYEGQDISFRDFALRCARNFGATILQRDESLDVPPKEREPSDYHLKRLEEARADLAEAEGWSEEEAEQRARQANEAAMQRWRESEEEREALRARYEAMLSQVEAWEPPTENHVALKAFMGDQLRQSIDFECRPRERPMPETGKQFKADSIEAARRSIEYHTENHEKEVERARESAEWVRVLYDSLPEETAAPENGDTP